MPVNAVKSANFFFEDQQPVASDSRAELIAGLKSPQKQVNPKYFYDARGSELFEQITRLREYYPTRSEISILQRHASEIAEFCGANCVLIEPGSGSSEKVRLLLDSIKPEAYVPLDISAEFLYESAVRLGAEFPWLKIHAICADFADQWHARTRLPAGRRVVFYPGSTIGNMDPAVARTFLAEMRNWLGRDGGVLIGVDLHKSDQLLNAAYNDAQGITAEFNLNILNAINRLTGADFDDSKFSHQASYNHDRRRIEMHLVSNVSQQVVVDGSVISMEKGETLHTENSYKYSLTDFGDMVAAAGFSVEKTWLDEQGLFSVHFLSVTQQ